MATDSRQIICDDRVGGDRFAANSAYTRNVCMRNRALYRCEDASNKWLRQPIDASSLFFHTFIQLFIHFLLYFHVRKNRGTDGPTDGPTDQLTDQRTDRPTVGRTLL